MAKQTKQEKAADKLVERLYGESCSGVQINIMDISKVFSVGRSAIAQGKTEEETKTAIVAFVETIRCN